MAQEIEIQGAGTTAKFRNPLSPSPYSRSSHSGSTSIFWWYFTNRELADYGRSNATTELGDNPTKSTLALFPGGLVIIPAIWTTVTTFQRIQTAQRLSSQSVPIDGRIGVVLYLVIFPALFAYMQSGLNTVWKTRIPMPASDKTTLRPGILRPRRLKKPPRDAAAKCVN